jgi:hypothetical protein
MLDNDLVSSLQYGDEGSQMEDEEEEDFDGENLIIIHQNTTLDDDKKVVYMSNINSCSLP